MPPRRFGHNHSGARSSLCGAIVTAGEDEGLPPVTVTSSPGNSSPRQLYASPSRGLTRVESRPRTSLNGAVVSTDRNPGCGGKRTVGDERVRSNMPFGSDTPFGQDRPEWPARPAGPIAPHVSQLPAVPGPRCNGNVRTSSNVVFG